MNRFKYIRNLSVKLLLILMTANLGCSTFAGFDGTLESYRNHMKESFKSNCLIRSGPNNDFDVNRYEKEADELYQKVVEFVKASDAAGISAENFDDYIKNYLESGFKSMNLVDRDEFKRLAENPGMCRLYKGIKCDSFDKFKEGHVLVSDFGLQPGYCFVGDSMGHIMETSAFKDVFAIFAKRHVGDGNESSKDAAVVAGDGNEFSKDAAVVEMLVDEKNDNDKMIGIRELHAIVSTMEYRHPELFGGPESFDKQIPVEIYNSFKYQNIFRPLFKKVFGFDSNDLASKLNENYRNLNEKELQKLNLKVARIIWDLQDEEALKFQSELRSKLEEKISKINMKLQDEEALKLKPELKTKLEKKLSKMKSGLDENEFFYISSDSAKKFNKRFTKKLLKKNYNKDYFVNKYFKVIKEFGLMAKLLGYSAIKDCIDKDGKVGKMQSCHFVDSSIFTVCSEIITEKNLPKNDQKVVKIN